MSYLDDIIKVSIITEANDPSSVKNDVYVIEYNSTSVDLLTGKYKDSINYAFLPENNKFIIKIDDSEVSKDFFTNKDIKNIKVNNFYELINNEYNSDVKVLTETKKEDAGYAETIMNYSNSIISIRNFMQNINIGEKEQQALKTYSNTILGNCYVEVENLAKFCTSNITDANDYAYKKTILSTLSNINDDKVKKEVSNYNANIENVAKTSGLNENDIANSVENYVFERIMLYKKTEQKSISEINSGFYSLIQFMNKNKANYSSEEEFELNKRLATEIYYTKYGVWEKLVETKIVTDPDMSIINEPPKQSGIDSGSNYNTLGEPLEYLNRVRLPLGEQVVLNPKDLKQKKGREVFSWLAKISRAYNDVLGYNARGEVTAVINNYQGFRDFVGSAAKAATAFTIATVGEGGYGVAVGAATGFIIAGPVGGLVGAVAGTAAGYGVNVLTHDKGFTGKRWEKGKHVGNKTGEALRIDLLQTPQDVNPAIIEIEEKIRKKINRTIGLDDSIKVKDKAQISYEEYDKKKQKQEIRNKLKNEDKPVKESLQHVNEDMGGAIGGGSIPNPGGTPSVGNTDFMTPNQMSGMGNPVAPTRTENGSGDKFTSVANKRKKETTDEIDDKIEKATPYTPIPNFSLYVESFDNFK